MCCNPLPPLQHRQNRLQEDYVNSLHAVRDSMLSNSLTAHFCMVANHAREWLFALVMNHADV